MPDVVAKRFIAERVFGVVAHDATGDAVGDGVADAIIFAVDSVVGVVAVRKGNATIHIASIFSGMATAIMAITARDDSELFQSQVKCDMPPSRVGRLPVRPKEAEQAGVPFRPAAAAATHSRFDVAALHDGHFTAVAALDFPEGDHAALSLPPEAIEGALFDESQDYEWAIPFAGEVLPTLSGREAAFPRAVFRGLFGIARVGLPADGAGKELSAFPVNHGFSSPGNAPL